MTFALVMQQEIVKAVEVIRSNSDSSCEEIVQILIEEGIERSVAVQLVTLLPLAYGREVLVGCGVLFSDNYTCLGKNGQFGHERKLSSLALWDESVAFARKEISSGTSGDALLAIAGRSPETDAINKALHGGEKLEDLVVSPPVFMWPEFNSSTDSGLNSKAAQCWWQFWKQ